MPITRLYSDVITKVYFAASQTGFRSSRWLPVSVGSVCLALLFYASWHAGRVSGQMEDERLASELDELHHNVAETQLKLEHEKQKTASLERALSKSGNTDSLALVARLRKELLASQAEANQYKQFNQLEQKALADNTKLLDALTAPGAHLLPLKGSEIAPQALGYALIVESSRMFFIGSNLPDLAAGKQYQLWVLRRQEPKLVSAGVFSPDQKRRAVIDFDTGSVLTNIAELDVTEEPEGGSDSPKGRKLMAGTAETVDKTEE